MGLLVPGSLRSSGLSQSCPQAWLPCGEKTTYALTSGAGIHEDNA